MVIERELRKTEIIDGPAEKIPYSEYMAAFDAVEWTNRRLGGFSTVIDAMEKLVERKRLVSFTVLDVGCGGGDVAEALIRWSHDRHLGLKLIAIDTHPHAVRLTKERLAKYPEASVVHSDFFETKFSEGSIDIVVGTLLLHHFTAEQLSFFLWKAYKMAGAGVVLTDLRRLRLARWFTRTIVVPLAPKSPIFANDAPLSIERAYTLKEMKEFLAKGGYPYRACSPWLSPFRLVLSAERA